MRLHPPIFQKSSGAEHRPVVIVQMPSGPDNRRVFARVLHELGVPYSSYWRVDALERSAFDSRALARTQVLIIEEVQQIPYNPKPWHLLHELKVGTSAGRDARYQHPLRELLTGPDLRNLAHQTRIDCPARGDLS